MLELKAKTREPGKKLGTLRKADQVPAVLYGPDVKPVALAVTRGDFDRVFSEAGESSLVRLLVDQDPSIASGQAGSHIVLIRDIQRDPLRDKPLHLDFHAVRLNEEIKIDIPLHFIGTAPVETRNEGVLVKELHELEVEALPEKLPHEIEVDVFGLDVIGAEIRVADLALPEGVHVVAEPDTVIVHAAPLMSEEEISAIEAPVAASVEDVEVIGAKKEEGDEETSDAEEKTEKEK